MRCFEISTLPKRAARLIAMLLAAVFAFGASAQPKPGVHSVPTQPGPHRGAAKSRVVPRSAADRSISPKKTLILPALPTGFIDDLKRQDAAEGKPQRVRLGFTRTLDNAVTINSETPGWTTTVDGSRVYAVQISSPEAVGVRLHVEQIRLPAGARLLVYDPANPGPQAVPFTARDVTPEAELWMPTVSSETVVLECELPPGSGPAAATFSVTGLSHLYRPITRIHPKASCELDVVCYPAWSDEASGVAEIVFVDTGFTYQCTGALINDSDPNTFINYFLTAHHCIGSQSVASTIDFSWFFEDVSCDGPEGTPVDTSGGADLLATSSSSDFAFMRLRQDPPDGVFYLGWSTAAPASTEALVGIHHPQGEAKRISFGSLWGIIPAFWQVQWDRGVTEEGSSGSPLFNPDGQIIGQLYGGESSCLNPTGIDYYGRFDRTYNTLYRWLSLSGTYSGLFAEDNQVAIESSGFVSIRLNPSSTFTASIQLAGRRYGFSSQFGLNNTATKTIIRPGAAPLMVDLTLDPEANEITGTISDGTWTANLIAPNDGFDRRLNPCPWQGSYTFVLPGTASDPTVPAGNSYATLKVDGSGNLRMVGSLADRMRFSQSLPISVLGDWPIYASLGAGKEEIYGWLLFDTTRPNDDINGSVAWVKKDQARAKFYPGGFTNVVQGIGSLYQKPPPGTSVLDLPTGTISFEGGNLPTDFSNGINIAPNNKVTNTGANRMTLNFAPATGMFSGTVRPPGLNRNWPFAGVAFQKQNSGFGYLSGTNETSSVLIGP